MGTIFKYNNQMIQCRNLDKKLKKMKLSESDIEIIKDNIPNDILEKEFVNLTRITKKEEDINSEIIYYIYQNPRGYYLYNININNLDWYKKQGIDTSEYTLVDTCSKMKSEYYKWNPETKTGIKDRV